MQSKSFSRIEIKIWKRVLSEETIDHKFSCLWLFVNTMTRNQELEVWGSMLDCLDRPEIYK